MSEGASDPSVAPEATGGESSVEETAGALDGGILFLCDHAANALPGPYGSLGLPAIELERHIAYDLGAATTTRRLAAMFGAPAVLTRYSRLLIDANRGPDDPTLVMRISDGAIIPGNARIDRAEINRRRKLYWEPYRRTVAAKIDAMTATGRSPALVSIHSFTHVWRGRPRPWLVGVLWDCDPRIPAPLIASLRAEGLTVGDNEPYDGALAGDTLDWHANPRGLANVLIELRQDQVATEAAACEWAERLAAHLRPILARPDVHMIRRCASRNGSGSSKQKADEKS